MGFARVGSNPTVVEQRGSFFVFVFAFVVAVRGSLSDVSFPFLVNRVCVTLRSLTEWDLRPRIAEPRPCGAMDSAPDFGSGGWGFESPQGLDEHAVEHLFWCCFCCGRVL
jgi:hypothetical protein